MCIYNYKKKNGSLVIEAAMAIMILSMASAFVVKAHIESCKSIKERILNEDIKRSIENLKGEIKYNLNKSEFEDLFKDGKISLKYDEDFGKNLLDKKISELEKGNDIVISIINRNEEKIEFRVNAYVERKDIKIELFDEFNKSWWMYYEEA